jgi:polysaccharide export outer membrane protein
MRLLEIAARRLALFILMVVGSCASEVGTLPTLPDGASDAHYRLQPGDLLRIDVFDVTALSGDFRIDETGVIVLPLAGTIEATGLTTDALATTISASLAKNYLKDPDVTVRISEYRHFFVLGEVVKPGNYPYAAGMTVLNAVAVAGGYSYRADHGDAMVMRAGVRYRASPAAPIRPGDTIEIAERLF